MSLTDQEGAMEDQKTLETAFRLMDAEDWQGAIDALLQADSVKTNFKIAWNLGWAYFKAQSLGPAAEWLKRACELKPSDASGRWALGEALAAADKHAEAEHELLLSLALRDTYVARAALGFLCHRTGRLEEAKAIYLEGIRLRPDDGKRLGAFADFLSDIGQKPEAELYYQRAAVAPKPDMKPASES